MQNNQIWNGTLTEKQEGQSKRDQCCRFRLGRITRLRSSLFSNAKGSRSDASTFICSSSSSLIDGQTFGYQAASVMLIWSAVSPPFSSFEITLGSTPYPGGITDEPGPYRIEYRRYRRGSSLAATRSETTDRSNGIVR